MGETIRVEHSKDYTVISNAAIRDTRLSFKSRGLHHLLLSYPNGWQINIEHLSEQSDKDGKDAVASALKELEAVGYLIRTQIRVKGKIVGYESTIREMPIENPPQPKGRRSKKKQDSPEPENPDTVKPQPDFPDTAKPDRENPQLEKPEPENPVLNKYVLDQLSNQEIPTPPNPQGEKIGESEISNSNTEDSNPQSTVLLITKPQSSISPTIPHEDQSCGAALNQIDNRFNSGRPQNAYKNCGISVASDPWMKTDKNPDPDFSQWVADKRYSDKSKTPLADAKAEIRNNSDRASDLWDEYQAELDQKAKQKPLQQAMPDAFTPGRKKPRMSEIEKAEFIAKLRG